MSDVTETLQELLERRLRELGQRRGRGESISLREAWQRLPEGEDGRRAPTYEVFRRIRQSGHTNISDETAVALATMLDVPVGDVYAAAKILPRLGPFELPSRAAALDPGERAVVLSVVDAILDAKNPKVSAKVVPLPKNATPEQLEDWLRDEPEDQTDDQGLRAVADTGDPADAETVEEKARKSRRKQTGEDH